MLNSESTAKIEAKLRRFVLHMVYSSTIIVLTANAIILYIKQCISKAKNGW